MLYTLSLTCWRWALGYNKHVWVLELWSYRRSHWSEGASVPCGPRVSGHPLESLFLKKNECKLWRWGSRRVVFRQLLLDSVTLSRSGQTCWDLRPPSPNQPYLCAHLIGAPDHINTLLAWTHYCIYSVFNCFLSMWQEDKTSCSFLADWVSPWVQSGQEHRCFLPSLWCPVKQMHWRQAEWTSGLVPLL